MSAEQGTDGGLLAALGWPALEDIVDEPRYVDDVRPAVAIPVSGMQRARRWAVQVYVLDQPDEIINVDL